MLLQQHDAPLLQWLFPPCALSGTPIGAHGLGLGTPRDQGSRRARIGPHLLHTMSRGPWPQDVVACRLRVHCGSRQLRITVPPHGLTGTPECAQRLEHPVEGWWHLTVSALFQARVRRAYQAHGDFPHARAAADWLCEGFPRPLTQPAQRLCGHRALHPEDAAVVQLAWIRDPLMLHQHGLRQGTEINHLVPVTVVPCHA